MFDSEKILRKKDKENNFIIFDFTIKKKYKRKFNIIKIGLNLINYFYIFL